MERHSLVTEKNSKNHLQNFSKIFREEINKNRQSNNKLLTRLHIQEILISVPDTKIQKNLHKPNSEVWNAARKDHILARDFNKTYFLYH